MKFKFRFDIMPVRTEPYLKLFETAVPFRGLDSSRFPEPIGKRFDQLAGVEQYSYIFDYDEPCMIEPGQGWVIGRKKTLLAASVPYAMERKIPVPGYLRYRIFPKKIIDAGPVVSLRFGIENYWHFFNDNLGSLLLLFEKGYSAEIPILVPEKLQKMKFFHEFIRACRWAASLNWVFQKKDEYYRVSRVILCKNIPNIRRHFA